MKRWPLALALWVSACSAPPYRDIDAAVPPILEADRIPGAVVVVGTKDGVLYRRAFGQARLDTVFDLASCTKVVGTTTAAMKLVEEGKLSLDEPVGGRLAPFQGKAVRVRELLRHASGFQAYLTPKSAGPAGILSEIAALPQGEKKTVYS